MIYFLQFFAIVIFAFTARSAAKEIPPVDITEFSFSDQSWLNPKDESSKLIPEELNKSEIEKPCFGKVSANALKQPESTSQMLRAKEHAEELTFFSLETTLQLRPQNGNVFRKKQTKEISETNQTLIETQLNDNKILTDIKNQIECQNSHSHTHQTKSEIIKQNSSLTTFQFDSGHPSNKSHFQKHVKAHKNPINHVAKSNTLEAELKIFVTVLVILLSLVFAKRFISGKIFKNQTLQPFKSEKFQIPVSQLFLTNEELLNRIQKPGTSSGGNTNSRA